MTVLGCVLVCFGVEDADVVVEGFMSGHRGSAPSPTTDPRFSLTEAEVVPASEFCVLLLLLFGLYLFRTERTLPELGELKSAGYLVRIELSVDIEVVGCGLEIAVDDIVAVSDGLGAGAGGMGRGGVGRGGIVARFNVDAGPGVRLASVETEIMPLFIAGLAVEGGEVDFSAGTDVDIAATVPVEIEAAG